jgi:hypothetical protein
MSRVEACTPTLRKWGDTLAILIVKAGKRGFRPGVVAIEYIDLIISLERARRREI